MRKRKALKGGYKFSDPTIAGPALTPKLYQTPNKDIIAIKSRYNDKFKEAERDLNQLIQLKKDADANFYKKQTQDIEEEKINQKASAESNEQTKKSLLIVGKTSSAIIRAFWTVATFIVSKIQYVITTISKAGKGAIIKAILAILFIILVIVGAINGFSGLKSKANNIKNSSDGSRDIFKKDLDDYLNIQRPKNIFSSFRDFFNNLIPNDYKYKLSSISNSLTYITTGNNQYDEYLEPRIEIMNGRSDNIFHVNLNKIDGEDINKTYSIIKPKNVLLNFNENLYYDSDYNKIDSNIKAFIGNYPQKCIIPITSNSDGKYILDVISTNIKYYDNNEKIIANSNLISPIFEDSKSDSKLKNTAVKLRSFNNLLYTNYFDANNILGAYATKLINPNYKGPIIRLSNASKETIHTENENKNGKRTADFYNDYNTSQLYTIIDNKRIDYSQIFGSRNSSVAVLYDQSVNNTHLKFNDYVFKSPPEFVYDKNNNNNSYIWFYGQQMLMFTQQISYKKLKIYMKFKFTTESFNIIQPRFFLATINNSVITIEPVSKNAGSKEIFFKYDGQPISKNYIPITDATEQNLNLNIKSDNPIILECLGNNVDNRTSLVRDKDYNGDELHKESIKNSLNAQIYELRIFKSDD